MLVKRLSWHGFVVVDHADLFPAALSELSELYRRGKLDATTEILDGLAKAPGAMQHLYGGRNSGRLCIQP